MKLRSIALIILVLSMAFTTVPLQTSAESDLESLIRLATQARDHIKVRLSHLGDMPDEISHLYKQGVSETEALAEAVAQNDVSSAKLHFTLAMKAFKEVSYKISSLSSTTPASTTVTETSRLKIMIDRTEQKAERLKAIATKNKVALDFSGLYRLIDAAHQSLQEGNSDEAIKKLDSAKKFIVDAHKSLRETADQKAHERAKLFVGKHIERLNLLIDQAKELGLSQSFLERLQDAKARLEATSDTSQLVKEVKEIKNIKQKFHESKVNRINAIIQQLDIKLDRLEKEIQAYQHAEDIHKEAIGQTSDARSSDLSDQVDDAKRILVALKETTSEGKLDEAIGMLKSLYRLIVSIEDSLAGSP